MKKYILLTDHHIHHDLIKAWLPHFCSHIRDHHHPNLGIEGHLVSVPFSFFFSWLLKRIPGVLAVNEEIIHSIPPRPTSWPSDYMVTLDQTLKDIGVDHIFNDPDFQGGNGKGVTVIVGHADSGITEAHGGEFPFQYGPAVGVYDGAKRRIKGNWDCAGGPPYNNHGTLTSQIIARSPRADGTFRSLLYNASIFYSQCFDELGQGSTTQCLDAWDYLAEMGVWSINFSGGGPHDPTMDIAAAGLASKGIVIIAAAGNSGSTQPGCDQSVLSPGDADKVICCGAFSIAVQDPQQHGQRFSQFWGSRGNRFDGTPIPNSIFAPAVFIQCGYGDMGEYGTSFSAPHVDEIYLSVCHKITRLNPGIDPLMRMNMAISALMNTALKVGYERDYPAAQAYCLQGRGYIQGNAAYDSIGGVAPPPTTRKGKPLSITGTVVTVSPGVAGQEADNGAVDTDQSSYVSGQPVIVRGKIWFSSDNSPMTSRSVTLGFGGTTIQVITDANGQCAATFAAPAATTATQISPTLVFAGDN